MYLFKRFLNILYLSVSFLILENNYSNLRDAHCQTKFLFRIFVKIMHVFRNERCLNQTWLSIFDFAYEMIFSEHKMKKGTMVNVMSDYRLYFQK